MYSHVMTDLETLGNVPGSIICSVGAVVFDIDTGELGAEFYRNVDRASCEEVGLTADPLTEAWWDRPENREAKNFLQLDPRPWREVARDFCRWYVDQCKGKDKVAMWSQGSNYDGVLLQAALERVGSRPPWKFYRAFDTRTAYFLGDFDPYSITRLGTHHNALDDAKHQVECVHRAYLRIKGTAA